MVLKGVSHILSEAQKPGSLPVSCFVVSICLTGSGSLHDWQGLVLRTGVDSLPKICPSFSVPFGSSLHGTSPWGTVFTVTSAGVSRQHGAERAEESVLGVTICKPYPG